MMKPETDPGFFRQLYLDIQHEIISNQLNPVLVQKKLTEKIKFAQKNLIPQDKDEFVREMIKVKKALIFELDNLDDSKSKFSRTLRSLLSEVCNCLGKTKI